MNRSLSQRNRETLRRQLSLRVALLSLVAVVGLLAEIIVGLNASLQGVTRELNGEATAAALAFTKSLSSIEADLRATSTALTFTNDKGQVLRFLLERQPIIFEALLIAPQGNVIAQRRRVGESAPVVTDQPWLETVKQGQMYLGPVDYSLFGVPFVELAVAVNDSSENFAGTLLVRTDFTALWNPVTSLRVGKTGQAYIVDNSGQILAYRDLQVVRSGVSLSQMTGSTPADLESSTIKFFRNLQQNYVIAAAATVPGTPWYVIVEQSVAEALRVFALLTLGLLVALGIVVWQASSAIGFTRRRIITPLSELQATVQQIQAGNFSVRTEIKFDDELGDLAQTFNTMTGQIQELVGSLEQRVAERTAELEAANRYSSERATRLKTIAEVSRAISSIRELKPLLLEITRQISDALGHYHVGIFLLDASGENAILSAANSIGGQKMLARGHSLKVGQTGIVGFVTGTGKTRIALDVGEDAVFFNNPDLPETRSEIALPLQVGNKIIGALDVQSTKPNAFTQDDVETLGILADQVAIAIENALLFDETNRALTEAKTLQQQYLREQWSRSLKASKQLGYRYSITGAAPLEAPLKLPAIQKALRAGTPVQEIETDGSALLAIPLKLRGESIGVLNVRIPGGRRWEQDEIDVAQAVADRVALAIENARLLDETTRRSKQDRLIADLTAKLGSSMQMDSILQTAAEEISQIIQDSEVLIQLQPAPQSE